MNGSTETCRFSTPRSGAKTNGWEYPLAEAVWIVSCGQVRETLTPIACDGCSRLRRLGP